MQQIIYIAYEDGEAHDGTTAVMANKETSIHILSQAQAVAEEQIDLSHFSSASSAPGVHGSSAQSQLAIEHTASGEAETEVESAGVNSTLHVIGQVPLDDDKLDPNTQYVDLSIKEGQQIRFYVETNESSHEDHPWMSIWPIF